MLVRRRGIRRGRRWFMVGSKKILKKEGEGSYLWVGVSE